MINLEMLFTIFDDCQEVKIIDPTGCVITGSTDSLRKALNDEIKAWPVENIGAEDDNSICVWLRRTEE